MFGKSNQNVVNNFIAQSHEASTTEVNLAKQGKTLTTLHSGPFQSTTFNGTPPKRASHNAGKRRVGDEMGQSSPLSSCYINQV